MIPTIEILSMKTQRGHEFTGDAAVKCHEVSNTPADLPGMFKRRECFSTSAAMGMPVAFGHQCTRGRQVVAGQDLDAVQQLINGKLTPAASGQRIQCAGCQEM